MRIHFLFLAGILFSTSATAGGHAELFACLAGLDSNERFSSDFPQLFSGENFAFDVNGKSVSLRDLDRSITMRLPFGSGDIPPSVMEERNRIREAGRAVAINTNSFAGSRLNSVILWRGDATAGRVAEFDGILATRLTSKGQFLYGLTTDGFLSSPMESSESHFTIGTQKDQIRILVAPDGNKLERRRLNGDRSTTGKLGNEALESSGLSKFKLGVTFRNLTYTRATENLEAEKVITEEAVQILEALTSSFSAQIESIKNFTPQQLEVVRARYNSESRTAAERYAREIYIRYLSGLQKCQLYGPLREKAIEIKGKLSEPLRAAGYRVPDLSETEPIVSPRPSSGVK